MRQMRQVQTPVERLSKRQREMTPRSFAEFLIQMTNARAALWVRPDTIYRQLGLDCWDAARNARHFRGPGPIIAHPPCGPWGRYAHRCKQSRSDGIAAMLLVHKYGGVVEQPRSSSLFAEYGCPCGMLLDINQVDFGHPAIKATRLFVHHA